jgi:hypothetical protein
MEKTHCDFLKTRAKGENVVQVGDSEFFTYDSDKTLSEFSKMAPLKLGDPSRVTRKM